MNRPTAFLRPALAAAALAFAIPACDLVPTLIAQSPAPAAKPAEPGWVQLFNGKDLTGWVKVGQEQWTVEDGAIYGVGVTKEYGYLRTEQKYADFDLTLRFKVEADGNSGVFFHSDFPANSVDISQGLQFEIDRVLNHHTGGIYGDGRNWIVWPAPELETVIRPNEWNELRVSVVGNRYVSYLNGTLMVDFTDPTPKSFDGYISLQLHSGGLGNMRFRDIYIRDLTRR
jgi:3-keto-disaccharide hydrolase